MSKAQSPPKAAVYDGDSFPSLPWWKKNKRSKRTTGTPGEAYANSISDQHSSDPVEKHSLEFYTQRVIPEGLRVHVAAYVT